MVTNELERLSKYGMKSRLQRVSSVEYRQRLHAAKSCGVDEDGLYTVEPREDRENG